MYTIEVSATLPLDWNTTGEKVDLIAAAMRKGLEEFIEEHGEILNVRGQIGVHVLKEFQR